MKSTSIESGNKVLKDDYLIDNIEDFDESELKKKKNIRIIIIISIILFVSIIAIILYLILRSKVICEIGENEKCFSCVKNSKKCGSCNPNFKLENGTCIFIYSFEAIYKISQSNDANDNVKLFNVESLSNYEIKKIQVDGKYIKNNTNYYKFDKEKEHKVRINIDLQNSKSLEKFFGNINELISINFTNNFNTNYIENMNDMFSSSKNLNSINISNLNTSNVRTMKNMFKSCTKLANIDISNFELGNNKDMSNMFSQCNALNSINFGKINTKYVLNMSNLFNDCNSLQTIDLKYLNTENVEDMSNMFKNSVKLKEIDLSNFKTDRVQNMFGMFENSGVINLDLTNFETRETTNMGNMFKNCKSLSNLKLDFKTKNVENMANMFSSCTNLTSLDISTFDMYNTKNFSNMFENDIGLEIYIDINRCEDLIDTLPDYFIIHDIPNIDGEINCIYDIKTTSYNTIL